MASNEKNIPAPLPAKDAGATTASPVAKTGAAGNIQVQPAGNPASVNSSPSLFGGHRGGGKKRTDGLAAGSPEAEEADRKKNRLRMAAKRAGERAAIAPPTLPPAASPAPAPVQAVVNSASPLSGAVASVAVPAASAVAPTFVAWSARLLEKPARLLLKIIDRVRLSSLNKKLKLLKLDPEKEKEIAASFKWKDDAMSDFCTSLSQCAEIELNRRQVRGAENSHVINVALSFGELALAHFQTMDMLDKLAVENKLPIKP